MEDQDDLRAILELAKRRDERADPGTPPSAREIILQAGFDAADRSRRGWRAWVRRGRVPLVSAAAAACLTLGALGGRAFGRDGGTSAGLLARELQTAAGESATIQLSDGTVVRIGPKSRLEVLSEGSGREVALSGRAFFAVTPDPSRPFRVVTPAGSARVLGTRFELTADTAGMRLVVVQGRVALAASDAEVQVVGGEMAQVSGGRALGIERAPGLAELSAEWMGHFLVFQGTALREAVGQISDVYGVDVHITDPALLDRTLSMWFSSRPLEEVLTVVCSVIDAPCSIEGRVVTIGTPAASGRGPGAGA